MVVRARAASTDAGAQDVAATAAAAAAEGPAGITDAANTATCTQPGSAIFNGTDISGANWHGISYRTLDVSQEPNAVGACIAACCGWDECAAWVVQSGTTPSHSDHNCTHATKTCCWLKPNGAGSKVTNAKSTAGVVAATPARPVVPPPPPPPPPGPPSPDGLGGYHVVIVGAKKLLVVERRLLPTDRRSGAGKVETLGTFDISTLENGLVLEAWNVLRVITTTHEVRALLARLYFHRLCCF